MKKKEEICPQCHGFGVVLPFIPLLATRKLPYKEIKEIFLCDVCKGVGEIDEKTIYWRKLGSLLKEKRKARYWTLREAAKQLGMDPGNLSKMERGIIKPRNVYLKLKK